MTDHDTRTRSWQPKAGESLPDPGHPVQHDNATDPGDWLADLVPRSEAQAVWGVLAIWLMLVSAAGLLHLLWHWWAG